MKTSGVPGEMGREGTTPRVYTEPSAPTVLVRVAFLDNLRYLMILFVLFHHALAAYASVAPHWAVHDTTSLAADILRELFDVFMMPLLSLWPVSLPRSLWRRKGHGDFSRTRSSGCWFPGPWQFSLSFLWPCTTNPLNRSSRFGGTGSGTWAVLRSGDNYPIPAGPTTQATTGLFLYCLLFSSFLFSSIR